MLADIRHPEMTDGTNTFVRGEGLIFLGLREGGEMGEDMHTSSLTTRDSSVTKETSARGILPITSRQCGISLCWHTWAPHGGEKCCRHRDDKDFFCLDQRRALSSSHSTADSCLLFKSSKICSRSNIYFVAKHFKLEKQLYVLRTGLLNKCRPWS